MDEGPNSVVVAKFLTYALGHLAIGVAVLRVARWRADVRSVVPAVDAAWLASLSRVIVALLIGAEAFSLWAHTASAFGTIEAWSADSLWLVGVKSQWGMKWQWQLAAAGVMAIAAAFPPRIPLGLIGLAAGALGLALATPLVGHAAGSIETYVLHLVHYIAAGCWLGTLGVFTLAAWSRGRGKWRELAIAPTLTFSAAAFAAAVAVAATGLNVAGRHLSSVEALWTTPYGRALAAKLCAAAVVAGCGWFNRRALQHGHAASRVLLTLEWLAALGTLFLTGVLTERPHP